MNLRRIAPAALAVMALVLLPVQPLAADGDYMSAGVGEGGRKPFPDYPLKLIFATPEGALVAGVRVTITRDGGEEVLSADDVGPWLLADLPAGEYDVVATGPGGERTSARIRVEEEGQTRAVLSLPRRKS